MERFADIQMLRYELKDFVSLTLNQKRLIYCLSEATLWGRDITTDQYGSYNLAIRHLLEDIYLYYRDRRDTGEEERRSFRLLEDYLKRVWFSNGIYHHYSCRKFLPEFTEDYLSALIDAIPNGTLHLGDYASIEDMKRELFPVMFSPDILPCRVNHRDGDDLVETSACNFYDNMTEGEVTRYYDTKRKAYAAETGLEDEQPSWGLNSRLVRKPDGTIEEETYRIGGRYSREIEHIVYWLERAVGFAEDEKQRHIIQLLIKYYQTGNLAVFDEYSIEWVSVTEPRVDFINGFIEFYADPLGIKGTWEGIVHYKDLEATHRTETLSRNAQWFEDNSPVAEQYKKKDVCGVTANVVCAAMLGGEEYPSTAIGINLPNADWIRSKHGSKSVTISNLTAAYDEAAKGNGFRQEYVEDEVVLSLIDRYAHLTDDLHTDLHECLGHGSGCLMPGVATDSLKAYASTIEEARADLFGLYYIADEKMQELGLLNDKEAYKAQYYTYMLNGLLTQCVRIPLGEDIQEAHMRNRALIANWIYRNGGGVMELYRKDGKTYLRINDYQRMRQLIGTLLAEVQRMKSEGDTEAARRLVEEYGVKLDRELHAEILSRYERLDIAPYKGFINPRLSEAVDSEGNVVDIKADTTEPYTEQMLRYSREYSARA